jgi:hypothetical protein
MANDQQIIIKSLYKSNTAINLGIDNTPDATSMSNLNTLYNSVLRPILDTFSGKVYISSGYRSKALNKALKGALNSDHLYGYAIDLDSVNSNKDIFNYIKDNLEFSQLIWEFGDDNQPDWVHVSYNPTNLKHEVLIGYKDSTGKTKYKIYDK